ncbi:MAG: GvpL/GvpF family gas vesicle protein, partial [Deltaproteobacteria bacterium]|nr:GvpL/GvpF family gas vesicle protein [Deltaproteobacteria bacterium]
EIIEENREIKRLKQRLMSGRGGTQRDQVKLGEMVKKALETKKGREERELLQNLKGLSVEHKTNRVFGDQMITNSAFLVKKEQEKAFDQAVDTLSHRYNGRMKLKYVGPVPPCNFVEIVVRW